MKEEIKNLGQAVNVLIQVAQLAQKNGVLSLTEAVLVKESIDFIDKLQEQSNEQEPVVDMQNETKFPSNVNTKEKK